MLFRSVTQPCWLFGTDDYMEVNNRWIDGTTPNLYVPGINGNNASSPDASVLDITGDIDLRAKLALDDWTPSGSSAAISKFGAVANNASYLLRIETDGRLGLIWSADGTNSLTAYSTVSSAITDGATKWIRVTLDVDNGASGRDIKFYTSDDGINWTQLGTTVTQAGTTSIFAGTSELRIGGEQAYTQNCRGRFYRAQIFNGIDGAKVFDADFENKITS